MEAQLEEKHQELQRVRVRAERPSAGPGLGLLPPPTAVCTQCAASSARCLLIGAPTTCLPAGGV